VTALLALLACGGPEWTVPGALAPGFARLDADHDGAVSAAEYDRLAWQMPPFAKVDLDGDGAVSPEEMAAWIGETDPRSVANSLQPEGPKRQRSAADASVRAGTAWLVVEALRQEVLAVDAAADVPSDAEMQAIYTLDPVADPAVRPLLARVEAASAKAGLGFPAALQEKALLEAAQVADGAPGAGER
jgi:hypothetical protein